MMKNTKAYIFLWVIGIAIVVVIAVAAFGPSTNAPVTEKTNREVALACTTDMATEFHIHPILKIFINGEAQEIPTDIGIVNGCMNPLHTHDNIGTIHVESPEKRDFTLADFFAVWQKPFSKDQIFDYKTNATHTIRETVNGKEVTDYENTILYDKNEIVIYYEEKK